MIVSTNIASSPKLRVASFLQMLARVAYVREKIYARDIAKSLNIDPANLSRIFTGVTSPSIRTFVRLVEYFCNAVGERVVIENFAKYVIYKAS